MVVACEMALRLVLFALAMTAIAAPVADKDRETDTWIEDPGAPAQQLPDSPGVKQLPDNEYCRCKATTRRELVQEEPGPNIHPPPAHFQQAVSTRIASSRPTLLCFR